jgi:hypothetical protein
MEKGGVNMERMREIEERNQRHIRLKNTGDMTASFELKHIMEVVTDDIEYLLAENKRLREEIKSHGPEGRNYTNAQYVACLQEKEIIRSQYIDFLKWNIEELHQKPFDEDVAYRIDFLNRELEQARNGTRSK